MGSRQADLEDILDFLEKAKKLMTSGKYLFVPRRKNMQTLCKYGLTIADIKSEIADLTAADYYKGPKEDFDRKNPGDIWEFKRIAGRDTFYVKLKIQKQNGEDILKCLSFHEDEFSRAKDGEGFDKIL